jgi:hypothetical protein
LAQPPSSEQASHSSNDALAIIAALSQPNQCERSIS